MTEFASFVRDKASVSAGGAASPKSSLILIEAYAELIFTLRGKEMRLDLSVPYGVAISNCSSISQIQISPSLVPCILIQCQSMEDETLEGESSIRNEVDGDDFANLRSPSVEEKDPDIPTKLPVRHYRV